MKIFGSSSRVERRSLPHLLSGDLLLLIALLTLSAARPVEPNLLSGLVWRNIGPFRGGRVSAVSGVVGRPGVFYIGLPLGGVWKTTSAGTTWFPVFDSIKEVSSVGAIEVAPSDPNVIYVGTGDLITGGGINEGNGMYKSTDAGKTWHHLGLDQTRQIPSILVDPHDPNLVLIAAQGNVHAKSDVRGVFRSTDGGGTWARTLYINDSTGLQKLAWAADHPNVVLATTVRHYVPPVPVPSRGPPAPNAPSNTELYKSIDEGVTWKQITGGGLPPLNGRTSVAVAMNTNAQRMFLIGNFGLYRSDDGGSTWRQMDAADRRVGNGQGGYNCGVYVDPKNPDIVYTINTSSYKSTDGGNTFTGFKGAPGGDDPQQMWIDPTDGQRMLLGVDQGATISLDGGQSWSSWYNQSTDQVYHISTDNSFPYWVYATQQDAGAIATLSRGNLGEITPLDWKPVPGWEWGTIVADPLDPKIVYASGNGISKIVYPSEQWINVSPDMDPAAKLRTGFSQPIVWTPWNQHELLAGFQYLMATTDGGAHWTKMSPDLTVPKNPPPAPIPSTPGQPVAPPRDAIEAISPSSVAPGTIWLGTSNGLVHVTRDNGKTWNDVSIPGVSNLVRATISAIDASHQDAATAYVAMDHHNTGDYAPYLYRTRDYGKTWTQIVNGLPMNEPSGSFARVIRADPKKAGLLFAGTESAIYVSFDDGDHWQSLMMNLPNTSYRDITMHGSDLVIGTYGRGIWILDDYSVLRQLTPAVASEPAHLFEPADAVRVHRNVNYDTPFPPEVPYALNPPDGAIIYYSLASKPSSPITLDVIDASGGIVRHLSSAPSAPVAEAAQPPEPNFWIAPTLSIPTNVGTNRVNWDLRYDPPPAFTHSFEINANPGLTPPSPEGPFAAPGIYTLKLAVDGKSYTQRVTVKNDPRSPVKPSDLRAQLDLEMRYYEGAKESWDAYNQIGALRSSVAAYTHGSGPSEVVTAATALDAKLAALGGTTERGRGGFTGGGGTPPPPNFVAINGTMSHELTAFDNGDMAPTEPMRKGYLARCTDLKTAITSWRAINTTDLPAFNAVLTRNNVNPIAAGLPVLAIPVCSSQ
jgi:photosystem II stability/assembly factor-like uncharacterized protein